MPTENERKYVLNLCCENYVSRIADSRFDLKQAYIGNPPIRVRRESCVWKRRPNGNLVKGKCDQVFCFKYPTASRIIEIETKIDDRDFKDLWSHSHIRLSKVRYVVYDGDYKWEIDFFKDDCFKTYFAMAEVEMEETEHSPKSVPDVITKNLVFEVPWHDGRFASKRIANIDYARKLYRKLEKKP